MERWDLDGIGSADVEFPAAPFTMVAECLRPPGDVTLRLFVDGTHLVTARDESADGLASGQVGIRAATSPEGTMVEAIVDDFILGTP